ncbi:MAG: EAL domain-containing protein [Methylococcales bacterium]|nr:EAL domain-containing protein [Methylococcales bacterium]
MKRLPAKYYALILATTLALLASLTQWMGGLKHWNNVLYDQQIVLFSGEANSDIAIITIDDWSLESLGRWPWSRNIHAEFIDSLTEADVLAVGLDILFLEPSSEEPEADLRFAEAIQRNGKIVLPSIVDISKTLSRIQVRLPIQELAEAAVYLGHTSISPDNSGVVRGVNLTANVSPTTQMSSFVKAVWKVGWVSEKENIGRFGKTGEALSKEQLEKTLSNYVRIPFSGKVGLYQSISYVDVLRSEKLRKSLYGKYVLVGFNAVGLGSRFVTPVSEYGSLMSGIELNAHALSMLLKNEPIVEIKAPWDVLLTGFLVFIPIALYGVLSVRYTFLVSIVFIPLSVLISLFLLQTYHLWFGPAAAIIAIFIGYLLWGSRYSEFLSQLLFKEKAKAKATLLAIGDAVITTDAQGKVEFMNPAAEKMSGYSSIRAKGQAFNHIFLIKGIEECEASLSVMDENPIFESATSQTQIQCLTNKSGQKYAIQLAVNPIFDDAGIVSGIVYAISDLTEVFNISQRMAHLATHDSLTELPNRVLLQDRLKQAINQAKRSKKHLAILFIDLDGFKKINDGLGHSAGDLLLVQVAKRLQTSIRQVDTAARWGGDEFIIMLENLDHEEYVVEIAEKILYIMSLPLNVFGQDVFITPSIGISLFPKDGKTAEGLLARADAAMYSVKESGRNAFNFYSKELNKTAKDRLEMEKDLRQALLNNDFEIYYQPQVDLKTHQIVGAEALIRWRHREKGLILPEQFISLAEDVDLIIPIGEWVLREVCQQLKAWRDQGMAEIHIAVNLSPRQFLQKNLLTKITSLVNEYEIKPNSLGIEVTESLMLKNISQVIATLKELKLLGISIALDDFGTGFSSLNYLKQLPIDTLKIDQTFIRNLFTNQDDINIVQAVIVLGHKMGMKIVAEGIETHEQLLFLKEQNCDIGQGYYFDKPLEADKLISFTLEN